MNTPKDPELVHSERRKLRALYEGLFAEVTTILYELDPLHITFEGTAPTDEYEPEARTILPRLRSCSSVDDARRVIHQEFVNWFGPDNAGSESNYQEEAERIWAAWQRSAQGRDKMIWPDKIMALENRSIGDHWEPTLGQALELAIGEWNAGNRQREFRLHLLFFAWYCNLEPSHITGYHEPTPSDKLGELFSAVYETFADSIFDDAEVLYVVGLMALLTPWLLGGDHETWETRSRDYHVRYRALVPDGLSPSYFEGRGAYGDYFAGQVQAQGGF